MKELLKKQTQREVELRSCEPRIDELTEKMDEIRNLISSQAEVRRNIEENLEYRKMKAQVADLTQEIDSLEDSILKIGGSKIESMLLKLSQERESLLTEV